MQVLNTTAIVSDYAGRDSQGGASDESFLVSSLLSHSQWSKILF